MSSRILMVIAAAMILTFIGCAKNDAKKEEGAKGDDNNVLAVVGGDEITEKDLVYEINSMPPYLRQRYRSAKAKEKLLDQLVTQKVLYLEAEKDGLLNDDEFVRELERDKVKKVTRKLLDSKIPKEFEVTDEEIQKYYEEHKSEFGRPEEIRASHILIKVEPNADAEAEKAAKAKIDKILAEVKGGKDFAAVASEKSEGPTRTRGGDLGFFGRGRMDKNFEEAAFALTKTGDISDVVRSRFGYHVIKLEERRDAEEKPFDEVETQISRRLRPLKQQEAYQGYIDGLKTAHKAVIHNDRIADSEIDDQVQDIPGGFKPKPKFDPNVVRPGGPAGMPGAKPHGGAPAPHGGAAPSPHGGGAPAPHGGAAPSPHGGGAPAPHGGAAPSPHGGAK